MTNYLSNLTFGLFDPKPANAQDMYGVGAKPTPYSTGDAVPSAYQSSGGTIFSTQPAPNSSYGGASYNSQGQIISTSANPSIKTPSSPSGSTLGSNTNTTSAPSSNNGLNGFDMKYYPGWNETEAKADWIATGGAKGRSSVPGSGNTNWIPQPTAKVLSDIKNTGVGTNTPDNGMDTYFQQLKDAAAAGDQAAIDQLNAVYGQQADTLNQQYVQAGNDQSIAEQELATQLKGIQDDINKQKTNVNESVMTEGQKAAEAARSAQRQNRNIMRALGVLNSTYAAEALQNPLNELAKQKAEFSKWGMQQIASLHQTLLQKQDEANIAKQKILSQYAGIKSKIQSDIRYNEQQKATSLAALKAGAQQNLATLQGQMVSYQQQLEQQKLGFATQIAQILLNKNPNANISSIMKQAIQTTGQIYPASQQVATVAATPDKKYLSGLA